MTEPEVLRLLGEVGAIIMGSHIVYASGLHGSAYVNKDAVYPHTAPTSRLCLAMAEAFLHDRVEAVLAPAIGGVILSQWTAHHLSAHSGREVLAVYAEKAPGGDGFVRLNFGCPRALLADALARMARALAAHAGATR